MESITKERTASTSKARKLSKVFDNITHEDAVLEGFGYHQELKRSFGLIGMIGFSFSIVTCWTALGGVLTVGIESGGPPVMIYSWIAVCLVTLTVAYSMAEMCSAYPVAGGQYSWVVVLAPPKIARAMSWVTGWFMVVGILAMGATNNFIGANFILGQANLTFPDYEIQRWHCVLVTYLMAISVTVCNIFGPHLLDKISKGMLVWNITSFVIVIVTLLATQDNKQSASFVFSDFQNETGFGAAMAAILGILQSFFGMCCYDAPAHMTEEMTNASKEAPKAIIMSVYLGAGTGLIFLITAYFCMGDIESVAGTSTGVPLIQIFYNSTGSVAGSCILASLITVIVLVAANALLAEGARALFAFARDHGLPFSSTFAKVHPRLHVPVYACLLACGVQMVLNSIYFGSYTGFSTVISIATEGFYLSYAMPLLARILSHVFTGHAKELNGPFSLGKYGIYANVVGFVFLLFAAITFNFPTLSPVDSENMNYCSAAIGVIALVSLVTWVVDGRKHFTGPDTGVENLVAVEREEEEERRRSSVASGAGKGEKI